MVYTFFSLMCRSISWRHSRRPCWAATITEFWPFWGYQEHGWETKENSLKGLEDNMIVCTVSIMLPYYVQSRASLVHHCLCSPAVTGALLCDPPSQHTWMESSHPYKQERVWEEGESERGEERAEGREGERKGYQMLLLYIPIRMTQVQMYMQYWGII